MIGLPRRHQLFQPESSHSVTSGIPSNRNDRLIAIIGREQAESLGDVLLPVIPTHRGLLSQAVADALESGADGDVEVELERRPDDVRRCTFSIRALAADSGSVTHAIVSVMDVTESVQMRKELEERATFDVLTRCYNRASILGTLERTLADQTRRGRGTAVIFIDLDRFKELNDRLGHAAGDSYLVEAARRLRASVRDSDVVGRIGGDEFLAVCTAVEGPEEAMAIARRIRAGLSGSEFLLGREAVTPMASIGVAFATGKGVDADALVARADRAMYESKRSRLGNPVLDHDPLRSAA